MAQLDIRRGDTFVRDITVTADGDPVNLTGATIWFEIKAPPVTDFEPDDSDAILRVTTDDYIQIVDGPAGVAQIVAPATMTTDLPLGNKLLYEIQIKLSNGQVFTVDDGTVVVVRDVIRKITIP